MAKKLFKVAVKDYAFVTFVDEESICEDGNGGFTPESREHLGADLLDTISAGFCKYTVTPLTSLDECPAGWTGWDSPIMGSSSYDSFEPKIDIDSIEVILNNPRKSENVEEHADRIEKLEETVRLLQAELAMKANKRIR